jgi:hypothetical protein
MIRTLSYIGQASKNRPLFEGAVCRARSIVHELMVVGAVRQLSSVERGDVFGLGDTGLASAM